KGSQVTGTLVPTPPWKGALDGAARRWGQRVHRIVIGEGLRQIPIDLVHMPSLDFPTSLPRPGPPLLATLLLPPTLYPSDVVRIRRPRTYLHCVSASQRRSCPRSPLLLPTIRNGVEIERFRLRAPKRDFVVALGRICPEKGFHVALDAARRARIKM